jgi:putative Mn2+ efflux pump MntP
MHGVYFFALTPSMEQNAWFFYLEGQMTLGFNFFFNSILLGVGLAMDAFSVSLANGLNEPAMRKRRMGLIAGIFAGFQFAMPMIGWIWVSTIAQYFTAFQKCIPWIALCLLGYIGGKMLIESIRGGEEEDSAPSIGFKGLMIQGIATSIDALSVGFTISDYHFFEATLACLFIGVVTFFICFAGLDIGKKAGTKLAGKAGILGGCILIFIGLEIFITSFF